MIDLLRVCVWLGVRARVVMRSSHLVHNLLIREDERDALALEAGPPVHDLKVSL